MRARVSETRASEAGKPAPNKSGYGDRHYPLVFTRTAQSTQRLAAVDARAEALGLSPGMRLSDARALVPELSIHPYEGGADLAALQKLALWCNRYSPWVTYEWDEVALLSDGLIPDPLQQGLRLDISGCAHLFGGEVAMARRILARLERFGLRAHVAIADGIGAAWALARFDPSALDGPVIIPAGQNASLRLAPLPLTALRLPEETATGLMRLGLRRIGDLYDLPAKTLTARFGTLVSRRLAQALGRLDEPLDPDQPSARYWSRLDFAEPIGHGSDIARASQMLVGDLCDQLHRDGVGALSLCLRLFLTDGQTRDIRVGCARASRDRAHLSRLLAEHLPVLEAAYGADALTLMAGAVEALAAVQTSLTEKGGGPGKKSGKGRVKDQSPRLDISDPELGLLVDRLGNRLGMTNLARFQPQESHIPEQAVAVIGPLSPNPNQPLSWPGAAEKAPSSDVPRPLFMLPAAEPVDVLAEIPDGPPMLFRWRGRLHRVIKVDGPERIAPEWWRAGTADQGLDGRGLATVTRDYYRVEDERGGRYWLYRRGLYKSGTAGDRVKVGSIVPKMDMAAAWESPVYPEQIVEAVEVQAGNQTSEVDTEAKTETETAPPPVAPRWYLHGIFS